MMHAPSNKHILQKKGFSCCLTCCKDKIRCKAPTEILAAQQQVNNDAPNVNIRCELWAKNRSSKGPSTHRYGTLFWCFGLGPALSAVPNMRGWLDDQSLRATVVDESYSYMDPLMASTTKQVTQRGRKVGSCFVEIKDLEPGVAMDDWYELGSTACTWGSESGMVSTEHLVPFWHFCSASHKQTSNAVNQYPAQLRLL